MATKLKQRADSTAVRFDPDTGLDAKAYGAVAEALGPVLADSYQMFIKTQGVHWNVHGPSFYGLHKLTEDQYTDLYAAIDEIAERIRALGAPAPASYTSYGKMGEIRDEENDGSMESQVAMLVRDNGILCRTLRGALDVAEKHGDVVTEDLLTERLQRHEQNGWMLRMMIA
jgi:starvation-inducible DNA-binding protein